jgi:hypothetical protein
LGDAGPSFSKLEAVGDDELSFSKLEAALGGSDCLSAFGDSAPSSATGLSNASKSVEFSFLFFFLRMPQRSQDANRECYSSGAKRPAALG